MTGVTGRFNDFPISKELKLTSPALVLEPGGESDREGWRRITWRLVRPDGGEFLLYHAVPHADRDLLGAPDRGDRAVISALLYAMEQGMDLRVKGVVSPRLLAGIEALQETWTRWRPARYKLIHIHADREAEAVVHDPAQTTAISAFSGGVDATFTLFRHLGGARWAGKPDGAEGPIGPWVGHPAEQAFGV